MQRIKRTGNWNGLSFVNTHLREFDCFQFDIHAGFLIREATQLCGWIDTFRRTVRNLSGNQFRMKRHAFVKTQQQSAHTAKDGVTGKEAQESSYCYFTLHKFYLVVEIKFKSRHFIVFYLNVAVSSWIYTTNI